jgi:putative hydrolase of the HAD superfamily
VIEASLPSAVSLPPILTPSAGPMTRYAAILFDMFDTLVRLDRDRLPAARIGGREVRSSVPKLHGIARSVLPGVGLEVFYDAFLWSYQEAERLRADDHREVSARERLSLFYRRVGADPAGIASSVTEDLLAAHMACLANAAEPMPGQAELLDWLGGRFRLGVVSNFDYTPTVQRILAECGILGRFETVVVSDTVGWRKPHPDIFERALADMGVRAADCLFVGDRPDIDVVGAKGVGMAVAWLNPERAPLPPGLPTPDLDLAALADLRPALEPGSQGP